MHLAYQHIANRINRRRARERFLAPVWESSILFACVFAAVGLIASVAMAASDLGRQDAPAIEGLQRDSEALAALMNGQHYLVDGRIFACRWKKS